MPDHSELRKVLALHAERLQRWRHLRRQPAEADRAVRAAAAGWLALGEPAAGPPPGAHELTETVLAYLWRAQLRALAPGATLAYYAGAPSIYGARNDAVEGVTRLLPLWAAAVRSRFGPAERCEAMKRHLRNAIVNGCAAHTRAGWGAITDRSTLICEAADVALALWLASDWLWPALTQAERDRIVAWLGQCLGRETADNNWHLFVATVDAALTALVPGHVFSSQKRLDRIFEFARGNGCFVDGPQGKVDLYNAWGFHYHLFWISEMLPGMLSGRADDMLDAFCGWYQYLFTHQGVPLWGRSLCYRLAVTSPLLASVLRGRGRISAAVAVEAYAASLGFFIARGALQHGRPTQGVFGDDSRWLDAYSGPASSLWGCRAMVLYLMGQPVFDNAARLRPQLPAERETVDRWIEGLGARLLTLPELGEVRLTFQPPQTGNTAGLHRDPVWKHRLRQWLYARASRTPVHSGSSTDGTFSSSLRNNA